MIKIIEIKKIENNLLRAELSNGKIFYGENNFKQNDSFERQISLFYISSNYEIDQHVPDEIKKKYKLGNNNIDKLFNIEKSQKIKSLLTLALPIKKGETVLELGAFCGLSTIKLSEMVGKTGKVIALEASSKNFDILCRNLDENQIKNVIPIHRGAWDSPGKIFLFDDGARYKSFINRRVNSKSGQEELVDKIDNLIKKSDESLFHIDVIVSDINGAEFRAVDGMEKLLKEQNPRLFLSTYTQENAKNMKNKLDDIGYHSIIGCATRVYAWKK